MKTRRLSTINRFFLQDAMKAAKDAGVTSEDLKQYVKDNNIPKQIPLFRWREILVDLTNSKTTTK